MERTVVGRRPVEAERRRERTMKRAEVLSSPLVGSSRRRMEGLRRRLRPSETRRSSSSESDPGRRECATWEKRRSERNEEAEESAEVGGRRRRAVSINVSATVTKGKMVDNLLRFRTLGSCSCSLAADVGVLPKKQVLHLSRSLTEPQLSIKTSCIF